MTQNHAVSREKFDIYDRPMIPLAIALMAGIEFGGAMPGYCPVVWGVVLLIGAYLLFKYVSRRRSAILPLVLVASIGYLSVQPVLDPRLPDNHPIRFAGKTPVRIVGTVLGLPSLRSRRVTFILQVEHLGSNPGATQPAIGKLRVTASGSPPAIRTGDRINFNARIRKLRNFNNPGRFDYVRYMACRSVRASVYVSGDDIRIVEAAADQSVSSRIDRLRANLACWIDAHATPEPAAGILRALLIGDRRGITPEVRSGFNRTGLGHLLAISGLHIGIVAAAGFFIFVRLFSWSPGLLRIGWVRKGAALMAMVPVVGYGLMAGMSPSTQRAVLMVLVFLLAMLSNREQDSINTLAFVALVILILALGALFSISFQLSFAAAGMILYGLNRLTNASGRPRKPAYRILKKLLIFMYVSFLAVLGTLPLTLFYFDVVSTVGILFNLMAVPLIGFGAVPLGLIGLCLIPLCEPAAVVMLQGAAGLLSIVMLVIRNVDGVAMTAVQAFTPTLFEMVLYYLLVWSLLNLRRARFARIILVVGLFAAGADTCYWLQQRLWHRDFRVTVIDVGQGSASLLEFPKGRCMLIDGGGFSDNTVFDMGKLVVGPLLRRKRIHTVDTVALSHPNSDHMNGLLYILEHFKVRRVWTNGQQATTMGYQRFTKIVSERRIHVPNFSSIPRRWDIGGVLMEILYPPGDFLSRKQRQPWRKVDSTSKCTR